MPVKGTVCVAVCTCQRPKMLERCLSSLTSQVNVEGASLYIVIVDNDATPSARPIVEAASAKSPFPVHYHHEPRRGIPMARNRALDEASALAADWLAFFDDDQVAYPDCVEKLLLVASRDNADAVATAIMVAVPDPKPFWFARKDSQKPECGEVEDTPLCARIKKEVATGGVLFSGRLFRADGIALRFNERLAFGGLEDGDFSARAHSAGALLVGTRLAWVIEEKHPSRFSYWRLMGGALAKGGATVVRYRLTNNYWRTAVKFGWVSIMRTLRGIVQLTIALVVLPFSLQRFKIAALTGGRSLCTAVGMLGGIFSLQHEFYRQIDGH